MSSLTDLATSLTSTMNLLDVALLRANANICFITRIWYKDGDLRFVMYNRADINVDGIDELVKSYSGRMKFVMGAKPEFTLKLWTGGEK